MIRPADEVFEDHLRLRSLGDLEVDLERNYADDVVVLCELGALKGRAAIRKSARRLGLQWPDAEFQFPTRLVRRARVPRLEGPIAAVRGGGWRGLVRESRRAHRRADNLYRLSKGSLDDQR